MFFIIFLVFLSIANQSEAKVEDYGLSKSLSSEALDEACTKLFIDIGQLSFKQATAEQSLKSAIALNKPISEVEVATEKKLSEDRVELNRLFGEFCK